ncbi:hypothetical protein AURDEDRAFT_111393 [Auricularia subglabra TFB-10046 SS5]|nr:hypothetical protein AURDEDRAFT_111393 [Auricularia subglabra TFB-10046 SS5]
MPRRFAVQVHKTAGRLLQAKHIAQTPAWYEVVLQHPPIPLPPRAPAPRTHFDAPPETGKLEHAKRMGTPKVKPLPVYYLEDEIRRQFFRDHPFEAFRPRILSEKGAIDDEHPIRGTEWTRLRQRGLNATPEDCVQFALNLHAAHGLSLSEAYELAVTQFRALQSERHIAKATARLEALTYGASFGPSAVEESFQREEANMRTWDLENELDSGALAARKRWKMIIDRKRDAEWKKGEHYVSLWQAGQLPDYVPDSAKIGMQYNANMANALDPQTQKDGETAPR